MNKFYILLIPLLIGGCTTMDVNRYNASMSACQSQGGQYIEDINGNLKYIGPNCSHIQPQRTNEAGIGTIAALTGVGALVLWVILDAIDDNNANKVAAAPPAPPGALGPAGSLITSQIATVDTTYILPDFQILGP